MLKFKRHSINIGIIKKVVVDLRHHQTQKHTIMNTQAQKIQEEINQLIEARKMNLISVNEYCSAYHALSQQLKRVQS